MAVHTFYRLSVWLPLLVPSLVVLIHHGIEWRSEAWPVTKVVQLLLMSLMYGGVPYALLSVWATWWMGRRSENEIKRLMLRAPILMGVLYLPFAVTAGMLAGAPIGPFLAVGALGAIVAIPLGYAYVGLVWLIREACGPRLI